MSAPEPCTTAAMPPAVISAFVRLETRAERIVRLANACADAAAHRMEQGEPEVAFLALAESADLLMDIARFIDPDVVSGGILYTNTTGPHHLDTLANAANIMVIQ